MSKKAGGWIHEEGSGKTRVVVYEITAPGSPLMLRWWDPNRGPKGNWRIRALRRKLERDRKGRLIGESVEAAKQDARRKSVQLGDGIAETGPNAAPRRFTIGETEGAIVHPETGKYPHKTAMRDELVRALRFAVLVWGADTPWTQIDDGEWMKLIRRRIETLVKREKVGIRTAEITVSRLSTAAKWLRRRKAIPTDAGLPPEDWKSEGVSYWRTLTKSARDPQPSRPRHTLEEMRAILAAAPSIDPRLALLLMLGAEYRLGQVIRARRSDLNLDVGSLEVFGQGKKGGEKIMLTPGQLAAAKEAVTTGYLRDLETAYANGDGDYLLFPGGHIIGKREGGGWRFGTGITLDRHVNRQWTIDNFHDAERAAGIEPVPGRGPYGLRRQGVDAGKALGIGPDGLKAAGGWSSTKIPNEVYAEETNQRGREEAMRVRAQIRGET
jgi:integrase